MNPCQNYKRTFAVLTGFVLIFLFAIYGIGFVGIESPTFKNGPQKSEILQREVMTDEVRKSVYVNNLGIHQRTSMLKTGTKKERADDASTHISVNKKPGKSGFGKDEKTEYVDDDLEETTEIPDSDVDLSTTTTASFETTLAPGVLGNGNKSVPTQNKTNAINSFTTTDKLIGNGEHNMDEKWLNKREDMNYTEIEARFVARRERYDRMCGKKEYKAIKRTSYIRSMRSEFANSRLRWCQIPKIATTFLKYVRKEHKPSLKQQGITRYPRSKRKTFFLVREPYARLVSGYLCKIVTTPEFWRRYGKNIVSSHRPHSSEESKRCGHDVTFPEFVKYVIKAQESGQHKNMHFMPIHELCSICQEPYDYIVHLETLKPDMSFLFDSVHVKIDIDIRETEQEIEAKSMGMMSASAKRPGCYFPCFFLRQLWWSFQARGFIPTDNAFPFGEEECKTVPVKQFVNLARTAYKEFTNKEKRSKQKRQMIVDLYRQVPLPDRLKIKNILWRDSELFEYDTQPKDLFPELSK